MSRGVFALVGTVAGFAFGGPVGGLIGSVLGGFVDNAVFGPLKSALPDLSVPGVNPGTPIAWSYGTIRVPGTMLWTTGITQKKHNSGVLGKGIGGGSSSTTYTYSTNVAIGFCEGPITRINTIWADTKVLWGVGDGGAISIVFNKFGQPIAEVNGQVVDTYTQVGGGNFGISQAQLGTLLDTGTTTNNKRYSSLTIYYGTESQVPDPTIEAVEGIGNVEPFRGLCYFVLHGLQLADFGNRIPTFTAEVQRGDGSTDTLQFILQDMCERAGLDSDEYAIDCRMPTFQVDGYAISQPTAPRDVFQQLQLIYNFDASETGYQIKFRYRNRRSDALIFLDDIATYSGSDQPPPIEDWARMQDYELPKETVIKFVDPDRDFCPSAVRNRRIITQSQQVLTFSLPLVMTADQAKTAVDDLAARTFIERTTVAWKMPFKYLLLDAGDIIGTIDKNGVLGEKQFRISSMSLGANGLIQWTVVPLQFQLVVPQASADSGRSIGSHTQIVGDTLDRLMDTPLLQDNDPDDFGFYAALAGDGSGWKSGSLLVDTSGLGNFDAIFATSNETIMGFTVNAMPNGQSFYVDRSSRLTVVIQTAGGVLNSIAPTQLFDSNNAIALRNGNGDWEVLKFQNATQVSDNTWELDTFLRGRRGTEYAMTGHIPDAKWALLDPNTIATISQAMNLDGVSLNYRSVSSGQDASVATNEPFTNNDQRLKPYNPVDVMGTRVGSDWDLSWTRRARKYAGWQDGIDVPLDEPIEQYSIDVYSNSSFTTVVNTYGVTGTPSFTYTAAQQTADFGSPQATLYLTIYQISARVGRGRPEQATVS